MRVLLDQCVPVDFGSLLNPHQVSTAFKQGWNELRNGVLLRTAAGSFDCFITADKGFRHQQNLRTLPLPVVQLDAVSNQIESLAPLAPRVTHLLANALSPALYVVSEDATVRLAE